MRARGRRVREYWSGDFEGIFICVSITDFHNCIKQVNGTSLGQVKIKLQMMKFTRKKII
jgi:hypothetical protein